LEYYQISPNLMNVELFSLAQIGGQDQKWQFVPPKVKNPIAFLK